MRSPGSEVKTLPDDSALAHYHGANHGIRACRSPALRGEAEGHGHVMEVLIEIGHRTLRVARDRRTFGRDFVGLVRDAFVELFAFFVSSSASAAWAAANRAIATR